MVSGLQLVTRCAVAGVLGYSLVPACTDAYSVPEPDIDRVEPSSVYVGESVSISIHGSGFHRRVTSDISGGATTVEPIQVALVSAQSGERVQLEEVTWRSEQLLEALVPGTLSPGVYDVVAFSVALADGFEVRPIACGDGVCNGTEGSCSCPIDCGSFCGDGCCNVGEDMATCAADCCAETCSGCGSGNCCTGQCSGDCAPTCENNCTCDFDCAGNTGTCQATCRGDSICDLDCSNATDCQPRCINNATCDFDCSDSESCAAECANTSDCIVRCDRATDCDTTVCQNQATCLLYCTDASNCDFAQCQGGATTCPGNIIACNRACP